MAHDQVNDWRRDFTVDSDAENREVTNHLCNVMQALSGVMEATILASYGSGPVLSVAAAKMDLAASSYAQASERLMRALDLDPADAEARVKLVITMVSTVVAAAEDCLMMTREEK